METSAKPRYVECPRDSWQGLGQHIPTVEKQRYLQTLLDAGFKHLDLGSFVSPKAVPQLADTEAVLAGLRPPQDADLLCIIANERGLERALAAKNVTSVGYPLSVNASFQRRNTNLGMAASWLLVERLYQAARAGGLNFVVYVSMGFGNPYGEQWLPQDTAVAVARLRAIGVNQIALADTVGTATPARISQVLAAVSAPAALGLHLHALADNWQAGLEVALAHGVSWIEGALAGIGGCPFAADALVANLPTEAVLPWLAKRLPGLAVPAELHGLRAEARQLADTYG